VLHLSYGVQVGVVVQDVAVTVITKVKAAVAEFMQP
jgi:hypothetical protein